MRIRARLCWEVVSTGFVVAAVAIMLGLFLRDRMHPTDRPGPAAVAYFDNWREWREAGVWMGPSDASVVVAVFMDFGCPYCKDLVPVLDSLAAAFPAEVAVEFHYLPWVGERFAERAAVAAECSRRQGRFREMYRALFLDLGSSGPEDWEGVAVKAGIPDLDFFLGCLDLPLESFDRINRIVALSREIGVRGTPKVWLNGRLFHGRTFGAFRKEIEGFLRLK